ncbi:MAG: prolyl oligopeptidase family serine peptidase [Fimbriimonadaceae bacterium]|nr:prolyl oligopeptidase family serine peptidase [Fimbriimonadaceae bacterium]
MILAATTLAVNLAFGKFERVQGTTSLNREITELTYPSIDGRETKAVLSMPVGKGPFPLIVTVHGGNSEKPYGYLRTMAAPNRLSSIVNDMNNQPWAILAVSYRNGLMGVADDDVIAGIRFGAALDKVDKNKVAIVGGSHGGYKVLQAAIRMGTEIRCVSAGSPWMVDPITFMKADTTKPPFSNLKPSVRTRLTSHGDESVPFEFIEPLYQQMKSKKVAVELFTVDKSPHGFYWGRSEGATQTVKTPEMVAEEKLTSEKIISFLKKNLD